MELLVLLVIPFIILGFVLKINPFFTIVLSALLAGILSGEDLVKIIELLGDSFVKNQFAGLIWLILPLLALLEINGIKEQSKKLITKIKNATVGRILSVYFVFRQVSAMLGLLSLGGHAQMVRPLIAPMAESAARNKYKKISNEDIDKVKSYSAATDNIGAFFGEDVFIAIQSILLIKAIYEELGISLEPFELSVWAIPSAICALILYLIQMRLLDKYLDKKYEVTK